MLRLPHFWVEFVSATVITTKTQHLNPSLVISVFSNELEPTRMATNTAVPTPLCRALRAGSKRGVLDTLTWWGKHREPPDFTGKLEI